METNDKTFLVTPESYRNSRLSDLMHRMRSSRNGRRVLESLQSHLRRRDNDTWTAS